MKIKQVVFVITLILGVISFGCMVLCYLAGSDIWRQLGCPNFMRSGEATVLEWQILGFGFWPIFAFHVVFLINAIMVMLGWSQDRRIQW